MFTLQPPTTKGGVWTERVIHRFDVQNGSNPSAGIVFDGMGDLYGATLFGPQNGFGLVFELKKPSRTGGVWTETVLSLFNNQNKGRSPMAALVFNGSGELYGTASGGDEFRGGNLFRLTPTPKRQGRQGWSFHVLHNFTGSPDGAYPATTTLVLDKLGNVFSNTQLGGTGQSCQGGCGTVYEVSP